MRAHTRQRCFWEVVCAEVMLRRTWRRMSVSDTGVPHGGTRLGGQVGEEHAYAYVYALAATLRDSERMWRYRHHEGQADQELPCASVGVR